MALTNTERSARFQQRLQARLILAAQVESFRAQVRGEIETAGGDPTCPETTAQHVMGMLGDPDRTSATVRAFLAQAVGFSRVQARRTGTD